MSGISSEKVVIEKKSVQENFTTILQEHFIFAIASDLI